MKNIFTIDPELPFLDTLAREIWRRADGHTSLLVKTLVLLPTRRACRHLGEAFARIAGGQAVLLPRMRALGDVDEEEMTLVNGEEFTIPPAIAPLKRVMLLTQQVQKRDPTLSWDQALQAAKALASFLDEVEIEKCDLSKLPELVENQELAEHWQQTLLFLEIITKNWPLILAEQNCQDPASRRNAMLEMQAHVWRKTQPQFPIIAAGSTGSIPATAELLEVVASLPQGAVVLPGLDLTADNETWADMDDTHPQNSLKKLLEKMNVDRSKVGPFYKHPHSPSLRIKLLNEAMRPAGLTEAWRNLHGQLKKEAVKGITRLTLDHPQEEAQVIALRLRGLLENPEQTGALVTADRDLAVRVATLLRRWGIEVDDSGGTPLALLPLGTFLNLTLAAASPYAKTVDRLALLKHPLAGCGLNTAACRIKAREAEMQARQLKAADFGFVKDILQPLIDSWDQILPLQERIKTHIAVAEALAASDTEGGASRLWIGESGEETTLWLNEWQDGVSEFPPVSGQDYLALFSSMANEKILRSVYLTHPRLSIWGCLEARLINADLIILAGMNEGVWPPDVGFDPWMARSMRKKFNLPSAEFRIGLSAHDFVQLASAKEVMLTRSLRTNGTPTVPSRFLLQMDAVLRAAGLSTDTLDALAPSEPWRLWAHELDAPKSEDIKPCSRPQPRPPLAARPQMLSVTEITTWLRNPYAIYAKHILKLRKLEELDADLDASDRGSMIHRTLEKFMRACNGILPPDAEGELLKIGRQVFAHDNNDPRVSVFWWARFKDIATWFINETQRRYQEEGRLLAVEANGKIAMEGFTLTGRADRLDQIAGSHLSIIDYKTGAAPKKKEVLEAIEPQLQLLALIGERGGFSGINPMPCGTFEYWILKGGNAGCEASIFDEKIEDLIKKAEIGLKNLIAAFNNPSTAYEVSPKPRLQPRHDDYAHLSRLKEWGRTAEDPWA